MKIKVGIASLIFLFIFATEAYCDGSREVRLFFYQGNTYYSEGDFRQAISSYEKALERGLENGQLYYNLGNAYFKDGFLGKAILNYLRAERLMPGDADLRSNLAYAQSLIKGGIARPQRSWLSRMFFRLASSFSLDRITLYSAIVYFILAVTLTLLIMAGEKKRTFSCISGALVIILVLSLSIFFTQFNKTVIQKKAVITASVSEAKFEPFDEATTFFSLSEGESVIVIASKRDWLKIRRLDDKQGWIKKSTTELI
jgi:tetratricopeptide (TPR) repeat protein